MFIVTAIVPAYKTSKGVFWSREEAEQKHNRIRVLDNKSMREVLESVIPVTIAVGPTSQRYILEPVDNIK